MRRYAYLEFLVVETGVEVPGVVEWYRVDVYVLQHSWFRITPRQRAVVSVTVEQNGARSRQLLLCNSEIK